MKHILHTMRPTAPDEAFQYMPNDSFEIYEKIGVPSGAREMHFHNYYEIMYVKEGHFATLIDDTTYELKKGDFILIKQNQLHHYPFDGDGYNDCYRLILWISRHYMEQLSGGLMDFSTCFSKDSPPAWRFHATERDILAGYMEQLLTLATAEEELGIKETTLLQSSYLTLFFVTLNHCCRRDQFRLTANDSYSNPMIQELSDYVDGNMNRPLNIDELADVVHLSKYHFVRTFKALTGMTVHDFVIHKKILRSCELIKEGEPISSLYHACGFSDYSSFFRNFKAIYGISPREYRAGAAIRSSK